MTTQAEIYRISITLLVSYVALQAHQVAADYEREFEGVGQREGIEIWRIENFSVKRWQKEQYGKFFSGDSYIVLKSYKRKSSRLLYNLHFWLGEKTTQDEAATAAWKTTELAALLRELPVQYREVQSHESDEFLQLFSDKGGIIIMEGGIDSGFSKVTPTEYQPRLLHVKGKGKLVRVQEVPLTRDSLNEGDVFILDNGLSLFQWNGPHSSGFEKRKGSETITNIREDRSGRPQVRILDGDESCPAFWDLLGGMAPIKSADEGGKDAAVKPSPKRLLRLSDACGRLTMTEVSSRVISKSDLDPDDVFIVDDGGVSLFVWVGSGSSFDERKKAFHYANQYIIENNLPLTIPVSRVTEKVTSFAFDEVFV